MNRTVASILLVALAAAVPLMGASCTRRTSGSGPNHEITAGDSIRMNLVPIQDVLRRETPALMAIKGVIGTGEGELDGKPAIVVYTSHISRENWITIPRRIGGYRVDIREVGDVKALPK